MDVYGKIKIIGRLPSSDSGNPRYRLRIGDTECRTAPDASLGYAITNYEGHYVQADVREYYGKTTIINILDNHDKRPAECLACVGLTKQRSTQ